MWCLHFVLSVVVNSMLQTTLLVLFSMQFILGNYFFTFTLKRIDPLQFYPDQKYFAVALLVLLVTNIMTGWSGFELVEHENETSLVSSHGFPVPSPRSERDRQGLEEKLWTCFQVYLWREHAPISTSPRTIPAKLMWESEGPKTDKGVDWVSSLQMYIFG